MTPSPSRASQPTRPDAHRAGGPSRPGRAEGVPSAPPAAPPAVTSSHPPHQARGRSARLGPRTTPPGGPTPASSASPAHGAPHWTPERAALRRAVRGETERGGEHHRACALARRDLFHASQSLRSEPGRGASPFSRRQHDGARRRDHTVPGSRMWPLDCELDRARDKSAAVVTPAGTGPVTLRLGAGHRAEG